jgi:amidase
MKKDPYKAFMPYPEDPPDHQDGPLSGLTFAVKDLFDVKGYPTGCGQPHVLARSGIRSENADQVEALLDAGAAFVGKTHLVELAFSLTGRNVHFGTPINPRVPERLPGGSSSGSAAAVAGHLADIGLSTDTLGSIRVPASYCGLYGLRPTHGRLSPQGLTPLAPSLDTGGWLTRNADTMIRLAFTLLREEEVIPSPQRFKVPTTFLSGLETPVLRAFEAFLEKIDGDLGTVEEIHPDPELQAVWVRTVRIIQGYEAWAAHGAMIKSLQPSLGPGIRDRFEWAATVTRADYEKALIERQTFKESVEEMVGHAVLLFPTAPGPAPLRTAPDRELEEHRNLLVRQMALASLFGLPELSAPFLDTEKLPVGLSLVGSKGSDLALCHLAGELALRL